MISFLLIAAGFQSLSVPNVLEHVRVAVGIDAKAKWQETSVAGRASYLGVDCSFSMRYRPNGQFAERFRGDLMGGSGFDGRRAWSIDPSGMPRFLWGEDAHIRETIASFASNRWLRSGVIESCALVAGKQGETTLLLKEWGNQLPVSVRIDTKSWLPQEVSLDTHNVRVKIKLSKWSAAGTEKIPVQSVIDEGGSLTKIDVDHISVTEKVVPKSYSIPAESPADWSYDSSVSPEIESKTVRGHLFVHPLVNGKDVGWFALDTCAEVMMIDEHTADSLGLPKFGGTAISGIGGTVLEPFRRASEISLGPAKVRNIIFNQFDTTAFSKIFGLKMAGIVGADVLKRFVASIDVEKPSVALYDRSSYNLPNGSWSPLIFSDGNPAVEATFEGETQGWFHLDVGSDSELMINTPFVKSLHLLDDRATSSNAIGGFGGMAATCKGSLDWFVLGGHRFPNVPTVFSLAEKGALANQDVTGSIGQPLMRPFTLVFDFGGYRIAFLPKK